MAEQRPQTENASGGADRRKFPRRNIALDVAFGPMAADKRPSEAQLDRTATVNLSTGGLCLYTDVLYPIGAELFCLLNLPDREEPMELVGTVAWFQRVSQDAHGYKLGLEFTDIRPEDCRLIERLVSDETAHPVTRAQRVLLVDDDDEWIQALKVRFESVGFRVMTANEGMEALSKSRDERPDLIVLDLMLPKLNGYEVCRLLKFDQKFSHIPIILCSARSRQQDMDLGYAVGADAYLTKPFPGNALLLKVDELLAKLAKQRN